MWDLLKVKPKYSEFNLFLSCEDNIENLENLEKDYPVIGLSDFKPFFEHGDIGRNRWVIKGFSTISLIATITDALCGKRLGVKVEEDGTISGWIFVQG